MSLQMAPKRVNKEEEEMALVNRGCDESATENEEKERGERGERMRNPDRSE